MKNGGRLLAECLVAQGVERLFCVPGESYLPVLDALADTNIDTVVARHEGGAAMMAEADGKLCGRPVCVLCYPGAGRRQRRCRCLCRRARFNPLSAFCRAGIAASFGAGSVPRNKL